MRKILSSTEERKNQEGTQIWTGGEFLIHVSGYFMWRALLTLPVLLCREFVLDA